MKNNNDSLDSKFPKFYVNHIRPQLQNTILNGDRSFHPYTLCTRKALINGVAGTLLFAGAFLSIHHALNLGIENTFTQEQKLEYSLLKESGNDKDAKEMFDKQKDLHFYTNNPFSSAKSSGFTIVSLLLGGLSLFPFNRSARWNQAKTLYPNDDALTFVNPSVSLYSFNSNYGNDSRVTAPYTSKTR